MISHTIRIIACDSKCTMPAIGTKIENAVRVASQNDKNMLLRIDWPGQLKQTVSH